MNRWIEYSIEYANTKSYLDDLFRVYPTIPDGIREIDKQKWDSVEKAFLKKDNVQLIESLLKLKLFPIKDSYIAYLRRDKKAIDLNPQTVNRLCGRLYELGLDKLFERCSEPKETNRKIGPMFKDWVRKKTLGIAPVTLEQFVSTKENAILDASDKVMMDFARQELNYKRDKGLDLVARFNGQYVIGEAKFLTDFGGHQDAQMEDALSTVESKDLKAIPVAILDGVLYIKGNSKMHKWLHNRCQNYNIMSALVLRDFLYQV